MSKYSVSYVYEIVDKYSKTIDKISRKTTDFAHKAAKATTSAAVSFQKFGKTLQSVGTKMSAAVTLPVLLMGNSMLKAASDAEETRSKYATVFQNLGQGAQDTADNFAKSFGLAGSNARKLLGDTGDMLSGFGFTEEAALKLSKRTNELAVDLASFTNFSGGAAGASAALTKGLLGERESMKSLGIAILEVDVKKKMAQMRSQGQRFATEREAKAYATLEIAISQSKNAIGDYARTKESFANVQRRVAQRNLELRESFGKIMIPAATKALIAIDKLQENFIAMDEKTKKVIVVIIGLVAVIGPLLIVFGTILAMLPLIVSGFWLFVAAVVGLTKVIAALAIVGLGVALAKWALGIDDVRASWNALIDDLLSGEGVVEKVKGVFEKLAIGVYSLVDEDGAQRMADRVVSGNREGFGNPAADSAANQNTLSGNININNQGGGIITSDFIGNGKPIPSNVANRGKK